MKRMVRLRIAALLAALVLALSANLALADNGTVPSAVLSGDNRGANGVYTGPLTLDAPAGYGVAFAPDGTFSASISYAPTSDGQGFLAYYLRADGSERSSGPYYQPYTADITAPAATGAAFLATGGGTQLSIHFSEPVQAVAGGQVQVYANGASYSATLDAGAVAARFALDASRFVDGGGNPLPADASATYTAVISSGAFTDAAGNPCGQSGELPLSAPETGSVRVLHDLYADMGWTLVAITGGQENALDSGASIPSGTTIKAVANASIVNPCTFLIYSDGQLVSGANLTAGYAVAGNTEISVQPGALSGSVTISGTAEYGQTLTASFASAAGAAPSGLTYAWKRNDLTVSAGSGNLAYALGADDIGNTISVSVTSPWCSGDVSASGVRVAKASVAAPNAPTAAAQTETSVRLNSVSGCEYRVNEGAWQASAEFTGLAANGVYAFQQRFAETETAQPSPASASLSIGTAAALTGTVSFEGDARVQSTVTAKVTGSNNTGALRYEWARDGMKVADTQAYTIQQSDLGKILTVTVTSSVQTGSISGKTAAVQGAAAAAPPAPQLAASTANAITLSAVAGCEYSLGGTAWQDGTTFQGLTAGQTYTFYQRYKATATAQASPMSAPSSFTVSGASTLTGTIRVDGDVRFGKTLVATYTGTGYAGTLSYIWYRGSVNVGAGQTYDVSAADINNPLYIRVVSSAESGSVTQLVGVAQKAEYVGNAPGAPTRASRSSTKISLKAVEGCEYSRDGVNWQSSAVFTGLKADKTYKFYQRYAATATVAASPASAALTTSTSSGSSSSGDSSSGGSSSSGSTTPSATATPAGTALNNYTLTKDNTRILYSTMESLVNGNKTSDVTIRSDSAEFTFAKATMQATSGTLWYDFGVVIDGCAHLEAAKAAAGEHFVSLVHFNMEGNLPAKATIRIALGAQQANKTLYYYKFTPATSALTFMQTSVTDAAGWASVEQSSCSDYVFLNADINAAAAVTPTPLPSQTPDATPTPSALMAEPPAASGGGFTGWLLLLIIAVALVLIVAGIGMYLRGRGSQRDLLDDELFEDEGFDEEYDADGLDDGDYDDPEADAFDTDEFDDGYAYKANGRSIGYGGYDGKASHEPDAYDDAPAPKPRRRRQ